MNSGSSHPRSLALLALFALALGGWALDCRCLLSADSGCCPAETPPADSDTQRCESCDHAAAVRRTAVTVLVPALPVVVVMPSPRPRPQLVLLWTDAPLPVDRAPSPRAPRAPPVV